jgi:hypothetical protein
MHFLPGSLSSWADKLAASDFKYLHDSCLRRKQVFPYDYFTVADKDNSGNCAIIEKLRQICLPPYSNTDGFYKTRADFEWAEIVFKAKKCGNMNDYMRMYLMVDVLLLAEVFEKFISTSICRYGLDGTVPFIRREKLWNY